MTEEIKSRLEQIRAGKVPEGYQINKYVGIAPADWKLGVLSDVLYNEQRAIPKPAVAYWRLGLRSFAKGTFHELVEDPAKVDMDELFIVKKDDLILNITFAWEHAIALASEDDAGLLVSHRFPTYVFRRGASPKYFYYIVIQKRFKEMLSHISPGGAGRNRVMSKNDFLKLPCYLPLTSEQQKIAEILMQCDKTIELKQAKIEELKKLKKACLNKMFPKKGSNTPEIRFPGFTDAWEQRKVGEILQALPFKPFLKEPEQDGKYEIVQQGNDPIVGFANGIPCDDYKDAVIFGDHTLSLYKPKSPFFVATDGVRIIKGKTNTDGFYLLSLLERYKPQSEGYKRYYSIFADSACYFTSNADEQKKIGSYFDNLDHLITLHQRELEETQKHKKAMMQLLLTGIVRVNV